MISVKSKTDTQSMIVQTFKKFDQNGDGMISREELKRILGAISGNEFSDSAVDDLLQASDTNKDGFISYEEFVAWVTKDLQETKEPETEEFKPLDKRGTFNVDYRKLLPERTAVEISKRYDLDKMELGAGGFGKVFIARDKEFKNRKVAVKKVEKPKPQDNSVSDFEKEIAVMKELDHPNICKLLASFDEGNVMFFIMELCEGGELFDRIIDTGSMSERQSSIIIAQTSSALAYAHGRGIAHRDIKPENIVFCSKDKQDFRIKLIDWGLAYYFEKDGKMNQAVGSMTYAAPEVINSQDKNVYSQACDIWSLGVLTYVMLCGKPPFWGNRKQVHANASKERYPFKGDPWDTMNPQAKDFIAKLLKADAKKRPLISAVVQHPWIVTPPPEVAGDQQSSVLANLKSFAAKSTFSRMCITAVARQLDHTHLKDIHAVFRQMDADGNGVLTVSEVKNGLGLLGIDSSNMPDIDKLFANMDMDGSNTIDYTEFCAAGLGEKMSQQNDVIWAAFKTFDTDNSGFVSVQNLKQILDSSDVKDMWSAEVCEAVGSEVVSKFDSDGDGQISFEEWKALMEKCWNKSKPQDRSLNAMDLMQQVSDLK